MGNRTGLRDALIALACVILLGLFVQRVAVVSIDRRYEETAKAYGSPLTPQEREDARRRFGLPPTRPDDRRQDVECHER